MQLSTTFLLLTISAYVHAQCTKCPETVQGETFTDSCYFDGENICHYTGGNQYFVGPYCGYYTTGPLAGTLDPDNGVTGCSQTTTLSSLGCTECAPN